MLVFCASTCHKIYDRLTHHFRVDKTLVMQSFNSVKISLTFGSMCWNDFKKLSLIERARSLYLHGTFITSIRYYKHKINLYLVGDYYVEVFYNPKLDRVEQIERLPHRHSRIKFYSDQIKLPFSVLRRVEND